MTTAASAPRAWGLLVATLSGAACSLALDFDEDIPCSVDDECMYATGQGTCEDGFCRPPGSASTDTEDTIADDSATSDTPTTGDPTTDPDTTDTDPDTTTGPQGCAMNSECEMDQRCAVNGVCVDLLTAECQNVRWPDDRDNVVFIGSIMPTSPPFDNLITPLQNAVQLAVDDFNDETALQGDRGIAWVGCDDSAGAASSVNAANHLIDNVGVPAIIGPIFSENMLDVSDVTIGEGVFLMSPTATANSITDLDDMDLVWRTIPPDVYQANALVDRMIELDSGAGQVTSLLVLAKDDAYGNGILAAILSPLEDALPMTDIYTNTYPNPTDFASQAELQAAYGAVLAGAASATAAPYSHVIFVGTSEIQVLLYGYLGTQELFDPPGVMMPLFTVTHGAVPEMERFITDIGVIPDTDPLVPVKPLLEANLQGTSPIVLNPTNFGAFSIRYRIAFNDQEPLTSSALSYDATLAALFAMCTVPAEDAVSGAAIASAMSRLADPDGASISFSGSDISFISDARNVLVVPAGSVDLEGVSGELEWDLATGDVRAGVWGWSLCDETVDASMPEALFTRLYDLNPAPATDGTWSDLQPCP